MGISINTSACSAFNVTVSDAKTETMCLNTKGMPDAATQKCQSGGQTSARFCIPQGQRQQRCLSVHRGRTAYRLRLAQLPRVLHRIMWSAECYPRAREPDVEIRSQFSVKNSRATFNGVVLTARRCAEQSPPQSLDSLNWTKKTKTRRPPDGTHIHAYRNAWHLENSLDVFWTTSEHSVFRTISGRSWLKMRMNGNE